MKITLIIADISRVGGTERAVSTLANMLCKNYDKVEVVSMVKTDVCRSYYQIDERISIKFLNNKPIPLNLISKIKWGITTVVSLRSYFRKNSTDIIISTGHNYNWLLPFFKINKETKIIACEHIVYESIPKISRFFMSITYKLLDGIVVLSEKMKESFAEYSKVFVIPNAILFSSKFESELTNKQILFVGRLSPEKGLERLIPIAISLKENFPDWKIVIVGDGIEKEKIRKLIETANLVEFVELKGETNDVESYYTESSVFIMTSHFEAFPMVLLEAQSFGLPVVAFDCPEGPRQIISNGENGFLVQNRNTNDFIEKISLLMSDKDLRKEFGANAKINSNKFSEEKIMLKWTSLFDKLK